MTKLSTETDYLPAFSKRFLGATFLTLLSDPFLSLFLSPVFPVWSLSVRAGHGHRCRAVSLVNSARWRGLNLSQSRQRPRTFDTVWRRRLVVATKMGSKSLYPCNHRRIIWSAVVGLQVYSSLSLLSIMVCNMFWPVVTKIKLFAVCINVLSDLTHWMPWYLMLAHSGHTLVSSCSMDGLWLHLGSPECWKYRSYRSTEMNTQKWRCWDGYEEKQEKTTSEMLPSGKRRTLSQ